jgi:hypothetical protein
MSGDGDDEQPPEPLRDLGPENVSAKVVRQEMWQRMNVDNKHFMGVLVGREGMGKSHSALSIASTVDPSFGAEDVFFDPEELLRAFQSNSYQPGDVVILDEAGVGLGSRSWYEKEQVLLNQTLQTVRDDNMGVLFTLPRLTELDSQTRGRLHAFIEVTALEPDEYALAKWKQVVPARDERSDIFYPYPSVPVNGKQHRVERVRINPPAGDVAEAYEAKKEAFKDELFEEAIGAYDDEDEEDEQSPKEVAGEIVDEGVSNYVSEHGGNGRRYVDQELIRAEYGLSHRDAKAAKKLVERTADIGSQNT